MRIRKAEFADLPRLLEIYRAARKFMVEHGNPRQWAASGWPPDDRILKDIEEQRSFVCEEEGHIGAVFYYIFGAEDPTYAEIEGSWLDESPYGVVHRIATDGSLKGAAEFCLRWAIEGSGHLRIDTHPDNANMLGLLKRLGFTQCGTIHVEEDRDPRYAFEIIRRGE